MSYALRNTALYLPSESPALDRDAGLPVEWWNVLIRDGQTPTEWTLALLRQADSPVEFVAWLDRLGLLPAEWGGSIPLLRDAGLPAEWWALLARDGGLPAEWVAELPRTAGTPVEWLVRVLWDAGLPAEWGAGLGRDVPIPVEWREFGQVLRDAGIPVEWAGLPPGTLRVIWDALTRLALALPVRWDVVSTTPLGTIMVQWTVREPLPSLPVVFRVIPDVLAPFAEDIHRPTGSVTETP